MSNSNLSKIEQIVPQIYGPNCDPQVMKFCENVQKYYLENTDKFYELFQYIINTKIPHFKLWLLNTLIEIINQKYANMSNETKNNFRQTFINVFKSNFEVIFSEQFIVKKYSLLFNKFIFYDFPENNNTIFNDILTDIYNAQDINQKINKLNLFLEIFSTFNEEYIQFRHTYNDIKNKRTNIIKDYMRVNTIPNVLIVIKNILENEEYIPNEKIIQKSILIISQLIDWIPFEYFHGVLNIILGNLINKYKYYQQCCDILYMIIKKGMDSKNRREILNIIHINDLINNILKSDKKIDLTTLERISDTIDLIGAFIIENFEDTKLLIKAKNNNGNDEINQSFNWSSNELRYYFYFLKEIITYGNQINYKESLVLSKSLDMIVNYFKSNDIILKNKYVMDSFKEIFGLIEKTLKIPEDEYSFDEDLNELKNDDDFFTLRSEFSNIYKNIYSINIFKEDVINSILNNLKNLLKINDEQNMNRININNINKYDIEFCLYLINILQEGFKPNDLNNNKNVALKYEKIYKILFSYPFPYLKNADFILLSYYDTFNKGFEYIMNEVNAIEYVIKLYLSEQGIFYGGKDFYKSKIVNYFDRFISKIKKNWGKKKCNLNFNNYANSIRDSIYKLINYIKNSKDFQILEKYVLYFHTYGIIISFDNNNVNKMNNYKEALKLFNDIINELNTNNPEINEPICELILSCLIQFIQSVGMRIDSIELKKLFSDFFDVFIGNYCNKIINNKNNSLLTKYISFLQRILSLLGVDSLKYLEYFFHNNAYLNQNVICECLKLLQNTINSLKKDSKILVKKTFNTFFLYVSGLVFPIDNISDENKTLINIFLEFIKTFNCITIDLSEVFFENNGIDNLNFINLIKFILNTGSNFFEPLQRRTTIKSIKNLCKYLNKMQKLFEKYNLLEELINIILNGLFFIYSKNNKKDAIDNSSSVEIAQCHFYFIDFGNIYNNYLMKFLSQNEIIEFVNIIKNVDYQKVKASDNMLIAFDHITKKILGTIK